MELDKPSVSTKKLKVQKFEKITKFINFGLIILIISLVGYYLYRNYNSPVVVNKEPNSQQSSSSVVVKTKLMVDISGQVKVPGVYEFEDGARIIDVLEKSGGFTEKVDLDYVEKNINKAEKVVDAQKIYIPEIGEATRSVASPVPSQKNPSPNSSTPKTQPNGKVSINRASKEDLVDLPEIGEVTADKIIAARPYSSIDEMVTKGAIKKTSLDKIRDLITL